MAGDWGSHLEVRQHNGFEFRSLDSAVMPPCRHQLPHTGACRWRKAVRWFTLGCPGPGLPALRSLVGCCVFSGLATPALGNGQACPCWPYMSTACTNFPSLDKCPLPLQSGQTHLEKAGIRNHLSQSLSLLSSWCDLPSWAVLCWVGSPSHSLITASGQRSRWLCGLTFKKTHFMALSL